MADLSPAQIKFLQDHLGYNAAGYFKKKQLKAQIQEFWRRRDKAQAEVNDLPPDHPLRQGFINQIATATTMAESGDLKDAYNALNTTKIDARKAANTQRAGATVDDIESDLSVLETLIRRLRFEQTQIRDEAQDKSQDLLDRAARMPDPSGSIGRDDILQRLGDNLREQTSLHTDWDGMADSLKQKIQTYKAVLGNVPTTSDLITTISHKIMLLNKADPTASGLAHNGRFTSADALVRNYHLSGKGDDLQTEVDNLLKTRRETLLTTLKTKTKPPKIDVTQFTDEDGKVLTGEAATQAAQAMAKRFKIAEDAQAKQLERAKKAYLEALKTDRAYLGMTEDTAAIKHTEIRKFETADMLEEAGVDIHKANTTPAAMAQTATSRLDEMFDDYMSKVPPGVIPDEVFELCCRSQDDWRIEIAATAGLTYDPEKPKSLDGTLLAKIEAVADAMYGKAQEKYPNKAKFTDEGLPDEISIGGETYDNFTMLGEGGGGTVYKGTNAAGKEIVLKTPIGFDGTEFKAKDHADMKKEAASHRAVSGGEFDPCHDNVLDMKGMVLAPNGVPLVAMDLAKGGDAKDYTNAVAAAEQSGLVSAQAKQAMMAAQIKDMLRGMKAMQDRGMTHHDLKDANVFMTEDGTFKIADFGLSRHIETRDGKVTDLEAHEFTLGYQPPEFMGEGEMSAKSDNFTLGVMLHRMTDPYGGKSEFSTRFGVYSAALDQRKDSSGKATTASALDRLMNALLDPDPSKRPSLEAALQSSFLLEMESGHTKEDLERLRKATAKYAAVVGKETKRLNQEIVWEEGEIVKLEQSKTDALLLREIDFHDRALKERQGLLKDLTRKHDLEFDEKEKAALAQEMENIGGMITTLEKKKKAAEDKLGKTKTALELEAIDKKIEGLRQKVIGWRKQIEDIHAKDAYKDIVKELDEANKAFA